MTNNHVKDISRIYLEQIVESSHLETDMKKRAEDNEKAREDIKNTKAHKEMSAAAAKKFDEEVEQIDEISADLALAASKEAGKRAGILSGLSAGDPKVIGKAKKKREQSERLYKKQAKKRVVKVNSIEEEKSKKAKPDYLDFDGDNNEQESMKKALRDKAKKSVAEAKKPNDGDLANNYPPYDKVTRGDVIAGALGKDQMGSKKKPKVKVDENFSNWREDLIEVIDKVQKNKSEDVKIVEKEVNNKININPNLDLGEAVEKLGGTLLEMVEVDEVDFIVETVYNELLDEGYEEDDIEEAIEYALTEATVTYGHDTDKPAEKKRGAGHLVKAVGRLARQKLSSKVRDVKKAAKQAVATGARKVAKGALGVARKMEAGDSKPSTAHTKTRTASTYRGAGAGQKEKVSSGSYTPPTKKKVEKPADPWEGTETTPAKPKAKTKKAPAPKTKAPAAAKPKAKRKSKLDSLLADIRSEEIQINEMPYQVMGSPDGETEKKIGKPVKSRKYADARAAELEDTHKKTGGKYRSQYVENIEYIDEKTLTAAEKAKKEEIFRSLKPKRKDFESRYPGRGEEVMHAVATNIAKKVTEQAMEIQPKVQQSNQQQDATQKKVASQKDRQRQQEIQILQRKLQGLKSAPKGIDPDITV